jgi:hypothetical protein
MWLCNHHPRYFQIEVAAVIVSSMLFDQQDNLLKYISLGDIFDCCVEMANRGCLAADGLLPYAGP